MLSDSKMTEAGREVELTGTVFMSQVRVCSSSFVCPALQVQRLLEGKVLQAKQPCDRTQRKLTFYDLSGQPQTQNKQLRIKI